MQLNFSLPETNLGLPCRSYKAIYSWFLPMLDVEVCGGGLAVNRSWMSPIFGLGQHSKDSEPLYVCCLLPATRKA